MRVLFVDDEFFLLESLQMMLRPICQNWQMEFVASGAEALALMEGGLFDVIVSDFQMPGMNGLELFDAVRKRFPGTARILVCDPKDQTQLDVRTACLHEVLCKPYAAESVKAAVLGASGEEDSPSGGKLEELMAKINRVPSIPALYMELISLMKNPDADIDDVGAIIAKDMTMTAMVLKMANSAYFGLQRVVSSTTEATMYLGTDTIRSLVLSAQVFSQFEGVKIAGFSVEALWAHSLRIAMGAKAIARMERAGKDMCDQAFVAGMLHDMGKLVLAANFPKDFSQVLRRMDFETVPFREAEREVFGVTHAEVGGRLLRLWDLPLAVVEAIALHHEPSRAKRKAFSPLTAVHAADAFVHEPGSKGNAEAAGFDSDYLASLGVAGRMDAWREGVTGAEEE